MTPYDDAAPGKGRGIFHFCRWFQAEPRNHNLTAIISLWGPI
jgi:hypothetical protein